MAGAVVLADALADRPGAIDEALAAYEARLRPWAEAAQRMARRNARLFTPANRFQLLAGEAVLRLAAWPLFALFIKRLLNREGERLQGWTALGPSPSPDVGQYRHLGAAVREPGDLAHAHPGVRPERGRVVAPDEQHALAARQPRGVW